MIFPLISVTKKGLKISPKKINFSKINFKIRENVCIYNKVTLRNSKEENQKEVEKAFKIKVNNLKKSI